MTLLDANPDSPADFLNAAYEQLEFDQGALISAANAPKPETVADWVDRGDWQQLAAQVGAESIFFVDHDPVIVFAKTIELEPSALRTLYGRIWCMARPQLLFLATPGRLVDGKYPPQVTKRFGEACATVVVGNPPWGSPKKNDLEAGDAMEAVKAWCNSERGRPIGDRELSQAFLHLTSALLKEGGRAGLLVSAVRR